MKFFSYVVGTFLFGTVSITAQETSPSFAWQAPEVAVSIFTQELQMLDTERDDLSTQLAAAASNRVTQAQASPDALRQARRLLALALHLSPRNKRAVIVNFQLAKGVLPPPAESRYTPQAFSRLLLTRGQLLITQGGEQNRKLSRYFIQLSAELDPKNDDAVYASELQRLDHGPTDWASLTDSKPQP